MNYLYILGWGISGSLSGSFIWIMTKDLIKKINNEPIEYNPKIINPGFLFGFLAGSMHGYLGGIPIIYYMLSNNDKLK